MTLVAVLLMEGTISSPGSVTELMYGISPWDGSTWSGVNPGGAAVNRLGDGIWMLGYDER